MARLAAARASEFTQEFGFRAFFVDMAWLVAVIAADFDRALLGFMGAHADVARGTLVVVVDLWAESLQVTWRAAVDAVVLFLEVSDEPCVVTVELFLVMRDFYVSLFILVFDLVIVKV